MSAIRDFLQHRLKAGEWILGQVLVRPDRSLRHVEDRDRDDLVSHPRPEDARELAKYDDAGAYRPLKTAPNLRHGWQIALQTVDELRAALDFFYPAAVGNWLAWERGELVGTPLRDTLARQTGMYRVTQLITDVQAVELIRTTCGGGCIRHRLWELDAPAANVPLGPSTVLCVEACNLLVAACRPLAKLNLPKKPETSA